MERIIGIVGAGVMGIGIAKAFAAKYNVILCDNRTINQDLLAGFDIRFTNDLKDLAFCSLVIEAIYEDYNAKINLYKMLQSILKPNAIICSNTSSLSINDLANGINNPKRFFGMHFMNPANKNNLVELIPSDSTDKGCLDTAIEILTSIEKNPIIAKDSPGFIVNRILIPMINDAINLYESGIASKEDIDKAMKIAAKHPIGPLELADMIGLDIILNIMNNFYAKLKTDRYKPSNLLIKMVKNNKIGKKVNEGFYIYD